MDSLRQKMLVALSRYAMVSHGDTVLAAVSGGPDSMAMLHALYAASGELGIRLAVAHMDHGLRPDSGNDAAFVREYAETLGLKCVVGEARLGKSLKDVGNVQDAARRARYGFLEKTADELGAGRIAVGHTLDDQAETYIMRVLRGAGAHGQSAIPPVRGRVIRPLIDVSRAEVMEYLTVNSVGHVTDPTNLKPKYLRNRVRLELMPALKEYNPDITATLARTADIMRDEDAYLDGMVSGLLDGIVLSDAGWAVTLDGTAWGGMHIALKRRALRLLVERLKGDTLGLGYAHVEDALEVLVKGHTGTGVDLPGGVRVENSYNNPVVYRPEDVPSGWSAELEVPGVTGLTELGIAFEVERVSGGCPQEALDAATAYFDAAVMRGPLVVRERMPGDRFRPVGMEGTRKLKELFIDMKMPRIARRTTPVLTCGGEIAWVAGVRQDVRFAAGPGTTECIMVRMVQKSTE